MNIYNSCNNFDIRVTEIYVIKHVVRNARADQSKTKNKNNVVYIMILKTRETSADTTVSSHIIIIIIA